MQEDLFKKSIARGLAEKTAQSARGGSAPLARTETEGPDANLIEEFLPGPHLATIPVGSISPAPEGQARQDFNDERLKALAESLKRSGVREPIIVTPHGAEPGRFQIVAGERRWRAAQLAGLTEIPCIVDPRLVERRDKLLAQAEENLHRENLNPVEEAAVLAQLMEARGIDVRQAGELIGKGYRQARRLHQIHTAAPPIKRAVARGQIDARLATELVRIFGIFAREDETPERVVALRRIDSLIERIVREQWPLRRVERYGARIVGGTPVEEEGAAEAEGPSAPAPEAVSRASGPLFVQRDGRMVIDVDRLMRGEISPEERAALIALLEDLLGKTRHARVKL